MIVVAVKTGNDHMEFNPARIRIDAGDLIILGADDKLARLVKLAGA